MSEHKYLVKKLANLERLASIDEMTSLYNHRYFKEAFANEIYRAKRYDRNLSLIVIDINGLKKINDELGHSFGDIAIVNVAVILYKSIRKSNIICRYGGDEFVIILPETGNEDAKLLAKRLEKKTITFNGDVTISIGVSSFPKNGKTIKGLFNFADKEMYKNKGSKR